MARRKKIGVHGTDAERSPVGTTAVPSETPTAKFVRLINQRMPKALRLLQRIANLGNTRQYEYTRDEADRIVAALSGGVQQVADAFSGDRSNEGRRWSL